MRMISVVSLSFSHVRYADRMLWILLLSGRLYRCNGVPADVTKSLGSV